jgi:hypothetical protein
MRAALRGDCHTHSDWSKCADSSCARTGATAAESSRSATSRLSYLAAGWQLVPDDEEAEVIRWAVGQVIAGRSRTALSQELTGSKGPGSPEPER